MAAVTDVRCATPADALSDAEVITAAIARLAARATDAASWPVADRRELLARLDRAVDALAAVRGHVLLAERESGAWQGGSDRSFDAWRSRTARSGDRIATAQVRQAERLAAVPVVAAAVAQGEIGLDHAVAIGRVASDGTAAQRAAVSDPEVQADLLRRAGELDAAQFATTVARWAATQDPDALERDHEAQRAARYLHLAHTARGTLIKGQVDTLTGHRIALALEAAVARPAADDDRDPGQRRADALDSIARRILSDPDTKPGAHVPPHVSLILSAETWHAARTERDRRRSRQALDARGSSAPGVDGGGAPGRATSTDSDSAAGSGADRGGAAPVAAARYGPATLEDGTPVPASELAAALCDCDITRIVVDADGAPVDLGRTRRLFSGPQRRAVIARDRQCAWPSCAAPARWCEIHHRDWWDRDRGRTAVDVGVLLCAFHHHEVHRRDLSITREPRFPDPRQSRSAPSSLSAVRYTFRDRTGRPVGEPPPRSPAPPAPSRSPSTAGRDGAALTDVARRRPEGATSPPISGPTDRPPEALPLEWGTDPVTGVRVPTMLLTS